MAVNIVGSCAVSLILPAYNESAAIEATLASVTTYFRNRGLSYQIIVAADGDDGTRERAAAFAALDPAVVVIGSSERRGKGKGIREGVRIATGAIIGFADADNKVAIGEFEKLEPWLKAGHEVVIGSRALDRSLIERNQRWYRRIGSWGFYYFMHLVVKLRDVEDTQCGFKFFPNQIAKDLFSKQRIDGYMFDIEILALAQAQGYRIKEVPIRWRDDNDSRLQLVSGNLRNLMDVFKIRAYCSEHAQTKPVARSRATGV
jgi:dolichyl-phosphate beta-glucosyltransferase